ncbi:helix-turn-helix transcriptional regulator [Yersinia ruckeri]|uniref:helix-turn-helix transcriptional regulator n=1 Tax=Yersinia ruckeri TaxID=29486 RepID=UPI0022386A5D|nr:helix-turn-helix transcriptional regulator [Yersinia ruckeri]MCW6554422.1 helix-turn-helix transcriptional regulator [Yersinia ruckeri]UZX76384.1 helix-turn-helix transcriptional regulator [Yersinia ruckeri]
MEGAVVRYILSWVEENIYTGASIGKLVDETGYSRRTLELWFLKYSGFPLGEYLLRRRMSRAAMLLRMTELSILEVSTMFHFYSSQNFTRSFRIFSGVTPTKYRKQDKWSVKLLQRPLLMEDTHNLKAEHCVLPELKLRGSSVVCAHNFILPLVEDDLARRMKSAVSSIRDNSGNEVCIGIQNHAFSLTVCKSRRGY